MNWIPDAKVGDKFRWNRTGEICTITGFKDHGVQVHYQYEDGRWGYTLLPQDIELLTVLDELADI